MKLTIGIKAFNEERDIAASIASALNATTRFGGEVILADSGSTDGTVEIARGFPVRIVQLAESTERCCGAGAQLAFQHAQGDYFYLLDGDMVLNCDFVGAGIAFLEAHPEVAAVGGHVSEKNLEGEEAQIRAGILRKDRNRVPGFVERLDGGGLYRTSAVRETGYFADRNLHTFEEFDLGARLQARAWKLARIDHHAVDHYGYQMGGYRLLWRRIRSGYVTGTGEILRGAFGKEHFSIVLRQLGHIRICVAIILWWGLLAASLIVGPFALLAFLIAPLLFLSLRRGSARLGIYSFAGWNVAAWGMLRGLLRQRVPPTAPLAFVELSRQEDIGELQMAPH